MLFVLSVNCWNYNLMRPFYNNSANVSRSRFSARSANKTAFQEGINLRDMSCAGAVYLDSYDWPEPFLLSIKMENKRMSLRSHQEEAQDDIKLNACIFIRCEHELLLRGACSRVIWKQVISSCL